MSRLEEKLEKYMNEAHIDKSTVNKVSKGLDRIKDNVESFVDEWKKEIEDRMIEKELSDAKERVEGSIDELYDVIIGYLQTK